MTEDYCMLNLLVGQNAAAMPDVRYFLEQNHIAWGIGMYRRFW